MVNFVATTRRWYDRGNPRDAGECYACQRVDYRVSSNGLAFSFWRVEEFFQSCSKNQRFSSLKRGGLYAPCAKEKDIPHKYIKAVNRKIRAIPKQRPSA